MNLRSVRWILERRLNVKEWMKIRNARNVEWFSYLFVHRVTKESIVGYVQFHVLNKQRKMLVDYYVRRNQFNNIESIKLKPNVCSIITKVVFPKTIKPSTLVNKVIEKSVIISVNSNAQLDSKIIDSIVFQTQWRTKCTLPKITITQFLNPVDNYIIL